MSKPDIAALEKALVDAASAYRQVHFGNPDLYTGQARRFCETCDALQAALTRPGALDELRDAAKQLAAISHTALATIPLDGHTARIKGDLYNAEVRMTDALAALARSMSEPDTPGLERALAIAQARAEVIRLRIAAADPRSVMHTRACNEWMGASEVVDALLLAARAP